MATIHYTIMIKITFAPLFIIDNSIVKKTPSNLENCWDFYIISFCISFDL
ncbi:hypothetical protein FHS60_000096 [Alloprevotella rava]|uniref:Uncharacterized protein n=1 Tax=Alloprevotella rava TaxID=671218 RepID=A0A7W5UCU4_9BACT|nr:hypothetical protein [Alloprevotella rava]